MYAVIKTGGKQYRVKPGDLLVVDKLDGASGDKVAFDQVLMLGEGEAVVVGAPTVAGAVVNATLIETRKGEKIKVFKKIRRQGYRRTQGHRQHESVLRVTGIAGEGQTESWDGVVDLTPRSVLNARARGLKDSAACGRARPKPKPPARQGEEAAPKARRCGAESARGQGQGRSPGQGRAEAAAPKAKVAKPAAEGAAKPAAKKAAKPKTDEA